MNSDLQRSAASREVAETALVWLLHELRDESANLIVLGGLVPEALTRDQVPPVTPHLGTTDVDLLLIAQIDIAGDLGSVERALLKLGFVDVENGWRWRVEVDGVPVLIEFLCDLSETSTHDPVREFECVKPIGCEVLAAKNLRGTRFVGQDFVEETVEGTMPNGEVVRVKTRFASLEGYLLSKIYALRMRAAAKDYYDFPYVLIHNRSGGPGAAGRLLREGKFAGELVGMESVFLEVAARYHSVADDGPKLYAQESLKVDRGMDAARLRADAVEAVRIFLAELESGTSR